VAAFRFRVRGRVQGVGFRYFVLREAEERSLTGFARNLADGSVEVIAEGPDEGVRDLEARLRVGSAFSRVEAVEAEEIAPRGDLGFQVR
jgi:acylphosphatase